MTAFKELFKTDLFTLYSDDEGSLVRIYPDGAGINGKFIALEKLEKITELIKTYRKINKKPYRKNALDIPVKENAKHI